MRTRLATLFVFVLAILAAATARAQFADQATFAGTGGGSANAQTATLANAISLGALTGVKIVYIPSATNTTAATFQVNSFTATGIRKLTGAGLVALTGGEVVSGQPVILMYDGTFFDMLSPASDLVGARMLGNSALSLSSPPNLQLAAASAAGALTITVETAAGGTPSASTPVLFVFPDPTAVNGDPVVVSQQAALSFTINSGNSMGCVTTVTCRLWIVAMNNSPNVALCAIRVVTASFIAGLDETLPQSSASGTSGGSSAGTIYCNQSSVTSKAMRILGYVEAPETTGVWGSVSAVRLFGPGVLKPGSVVQALYYTTTTTATGGAGKVDISGWTATPQITPHSVANLVRVRLAGNATSAQGDTAGIQMFRGTDATLIGTISQGGSGTNVGQGTTPWTVASEVMDSPATTSSTTYGACILAGGTGTVWLNGSGVGNGGPGMITIEEIQGALEPANDNGEPITMVG